jgi:hypothetical protein
VEEANGGGGRQWWALKKVRISMQSEGGLTNLRKMGSRRSPESQTAQGRGSRGQGGRDESERDRERVSERDQERLRERDRARPRETEGEQGRESDGAGNCGGERELRRKKKNSEEGAPGPRLRSEPHGSSRGAASHPETRCRAPITSEPRCRCLAHSRTARGCPVPSRYPLSPLSSPTIAGCPPYRHRPFR